MGLAHVNLVLILQNLGEKVPGFSHGEVSSRPLSKIKMRFLSTSIADGNINVQRSNRGYLKLFLRS